MSPVAQVAAVVAAAIHVLFFLMESVWFTRPQVYARFGVTSVRRPRAGAPTDMPLVSVLTSQYSGWGDHGGDSGGHGSRPGAAYPPRLGVPRRRPGRVPGRTRGTHRGGRQRAYLAAA